MTSAATITSIAVSTCQNGILDESQYVNSDELMLEELERRDGMYSFIFHELDSSKLTKAVEPENNHNHSPIQIHELDSPKLAKIVEPQINRNHSPNSRNSLSREMYFKKLELHGTRTAAEVIRTTKGSEGVKSASTIKSITGACQFTGGVSASTSTSTSTTMATTTVAATAITTATTTKETTTKLPTQNELLRYQQYLRTWYPPTRRPPTPPTVRTRSMNFMKSSSASSTPAMSCSGGGPTSSTFYLSKRPSNLYVCMMNCGVSVRQQPPRFSHITEPLVRNRRHALKESEEYKQRSSNLNSLRAPDLRALFPYDPDVHAPFLTSKADSAPGCLIEQHLDGKSREKSLLAAAAANGELK